MELSILGGKLNPEEADELRKRLKRGRQQYKITASDLAKFLSVDLRTVTNWFAKERILSHDAARRLIGAIIFHEKAIEYRKNSDHEHSRNGEPVECLLKPPCDAWYASFRRWSLRAARPWLFPPEMIVEKAPRAIVHEDDIEMLADLLVAAVKSNQQTGVGASKVSKIKAEIVKCLRAHGPRMAQDYSWDLGSKMLNDPWVDDASPALKKKPKEFAMQAVMRAIDDAGWGHRPNEVTVDMWSRVRP
jgi:transcriptional regulator with XRE-family HTH domain